MQVSRYPATCICHVLAFQQFWLPAAARDQLVLGIESSCDDTGAAVVNSSGQVLGEALATQVGGLLLTVLCNRLSWPCALQPGADKLGRPGCNVPRMRAG